MKNPIQALAIILPIIMLFKANAQTITISGYVRDANSKEVLIGASVAAPLQHSGAITNLYGFFSLTVHQSDTLRLLITYAGYQGQWQNLANPQSKQLNIFLSSQQAMINEVTVNGSRSNRQVTNTRMGTIDVPLKAIKELPVLLGEHDVLKTLQLLPGVQQAQEGTSGFYVRGGNLDQNLVLLDEAPIYNPNHLFGLFSTFNVNAVNSVKLIKGDFPAEYGGRLSSVLDISMKDGNKAHYQTEAGIGLLSANITIQGPIQKDKSSFIISARHSYINLLLKPLTSNSTSYNFYDVNAKLNVELGKRDHLFLSGFKGSDDAAYTGANSLNYGIDFGNTTGTIRWNHLYGNKIFSNTSFIYNDYHLQLGTTQTNYYEVLYTSVKDLNGKTDFTAVLSPEHTLKFGINYIHHNLSPASVSAKVPKKGSQFVINPDSIPKRYSNETAIYGGDEYQLSNQLSLNYGLRLPIFSGGNKTYYALEPRLTARYLLNEKSSVKAGYTQSNQFVHLIPNSTASLPADIWLSSSALIKPQHSAQYSAGYYRNLNNNGIEASVEVYYKQMDNQVLFKQGTKLSSTTNLDGVLTFGRGKSYGIEFFAKKNFGKLTGWASYTLSKTMQQFPELNAGNNFPASFDRTHNLALVGSYEINKHWTFSADFVLTSGRPYTLPAGKVTVYGDGSLYDNYYYDYTSRNNSRLGTYHRLDISFSNRKSQKLFHKYSFEREWIFGFYNVYSRANPYFVYLTIDAATKQPQAKQVSLLPIIPSLTYNIKF